jgi:sucrose-6-phosphate hydrolase SacC (GH32 family)
MRRFACCRLLVLLLAWPSLPLLAAEIDFPRKLVQWQPSTDNPIFTALGAGTWEVKIRERGWILREGDRWHFWYTGYDGTRPGLKMLGYASSRDGLHWERFPENPIYREHWVEDMMVIREGDTYYMFSEGEGDRAQLLTSTNGLRWTRVGTLDVRYADGRPLSPGPFGTPTVWREDNRWHLFYERGDLGVWLARSDDLKVWTNVQDEPVLSLGPSAYDNRQIALNQVIQFDGCYYGYYHSSSTDDPKRWSTCLAGSTDLVHWTKYPGNPILEGNRSSPMVVDDGSGLRLYTTHDQVEVFFSKP